MNENTYFIDLLKDENLSKIDIDPALIPAFKNVMMNIQKYFDERGYTNDRDYARLFRDFILTDDEDKKMSFDVSDEPSKRGATGFYVGKKHRIVIDKSIINSRDLEKTLCHEFIHFLVMHQMYFIKDVKKIKGNEENPIFRGGDGGFINEALTELLARQIYPEHAGSYEAQVSMLKFANIICNQSNNFRQFLQCGMDVSAGGPGWINFINNVEDFHQKLRGKYYTLEDARNSSDYISAQRHLIQSIIHPHLISSIEDYKNVITKLFYRPVEDKEYIDKLVKECQNSLLSNIPKNLRELYIEYLDKLRSNIESRERYNKMIFSEIFYNKRVEVDINRMVYVDGECIGKTNTGVFSLEIDGKVVKVDINVSELKEKRKQKLQQLGDEETNLTNVLNNFKDIENILYALSKDDLVKVIRYDLPDVEMKKRKQSIYIAVFRNRIELITPMEKLGVLKNINLYKYDGRAYPYDNTAGIQANKLYSMEQAYSFTLLSSKMIENGIINLLRDNLTKNLTQEEKNVIIEKYRKSDSYDETDEKSIEYWALDSHARSQYKELTDEKMASLRQQIIDNHFKVLISSKDGEIVISKLIDQMAFNAQSEVLINTNGNGKYNSCMKDLEEHAIFYRGQKLPLNSMGNIIFPTPILRKEDTAEESKEESIEDFRDRIGFFDWESEKQRLNTRIEYIKKQRGYDKLSEDERIILDSQIDIIIKERRRIMDPSFSKESVENLVYTADNIKNDIKLLKETFEYDLMTDRERKMFDQLIIERYRELNREIEQRKREIEMYREKTEYPDGEGYDGIEGPRK